ncbi:MAG: alpha/beta fold hydrolase [Bacteroidetes bacterium]|jgi:pimeloyl-ACP methyl ester carboxylesterase|nr:alpha/beta fold hydrolase [Bacteroidota bacterium]
MIYRKKKQGDLTTRQLLLSGEKVVSYTDSEYGDVTLLFIHGFPFNKDLWQPQLSYFSAYCRVIAYDVRGYGCSSLVAKDYTLDDLGDDLVQLINTLQLNNVILCGLSMGGYISLNVVSRYPEKVAGIILCDTQCNADTDEAREKRFHAIDILQKGGKSAYIQTSINNLFSQHTFHSHPETVEYVRHMMQKAESEIICNTLRALASRHETCSSLSQIKVPALIICGMEDTMTPVAKAEYMHQQIEGSTLQLIPQSGHVSNLEATEVFNSCVADFIQKNFE